MELAESFNCKAWARRIIGRKSLLQLALERLPGLTRGKGLDKGPEGPGGECDEDAYPTIGRDQSVVQLKIESLEIFRYVVAIKLSNVQSGAGSLSVQYPNSRLGRNLEGRGFKYFGDLNGSCDFGAFSIPRAGSLQGAPGCFEDMVCPRYRVIVIMMDLVHMAIVIARHLFNMNNVSFRGVDFGHTSGWEEGVNGMDERSRFRVFMLMLMLMLVFMLLLTPRQPGRC
jgi:hypothetical protein